MNSEETVWSKTLVPANGLLVIDPATSRALAEEGATVRGNADYWLRRLRDGDVTEVVTTEVTSTPKPTPSQPTISKGSKS
jgi:hypothetical protein